MGARTNFELKDEKGSVWLYSHWGGDSKVRDFAYALQKAEPRWGDVPYAIRIVVSQLIGNEWTSETGFGLTSYQAGEESYDTLSADFTNNTVTYHSIVFDFEHFVEEYANSLTNV